MRAPCEENPQFREDIDRIADAASIDRLKLLSAVKQARALEVFAGSDEGMLRPLGTSTRRKTTTTHDSESLVRPKAVGGARLVRGRLSAESAQGLGHPYDGDFRRRCDLPPAPLDLGDQLLALEARMPRRCLPSGQRAPRMLAGAPRSWTGLRRRLDIAKRRGTSRPRMSSRTSSHTIWCEDTKVHKLSGMLSRV